MSVKKIEDMSFEEALKELENSVKKIDQGTESLDASIEAFERGTLLKAHCEKKLQEAKLKIEKIVQKSDGSIAAEEINSL